MSKQIKLVLIDSHALIHRAYHALPPFTAPDGRPTGAVYGFVTMLLKVMSTVKPTHMIAAFDLKGPTFRHEEFKDYKAHRKVADDELVSQFGLVREVVEAFGIPTLSAQGFEADDVIGTICQQVAPQVKVVIVTGDKDTLQLVNEKISVLTLKRGISDTIMYTPEIVETEFGFGPEHVVDYKGLRGDPSDNIPGVAGIGDKTAKDLIIEFGGIENIYQNLDKTSKRAQTRLEGNQEIALQSRKLATISWEAPIEFSLEKAELDEPEGDRLIKLFEELGFNSLIPKLPKKVKQGEEKGELSKGRNDLLFDTSEKQEKLKKILKKQKIIAFDTENDALGARKYPIVGMSFAWREGEEIKSAYVPVVAKKVEDWRDILEADEIKKTGHNLKYDEEVIAQSGLGLKGIVFDSMLASYLLMPESRQHSLDGVALRELGKRMISITELIGSGQNQKRMSEVDLNRLAEYAAEDAEISFELYEKMSPLISEAGLTRVLEEIELPLLEVLVHMELAGVKLNQEKIAELELKIEKRVTSLKKKIWKEVGEEFNVNSTQQLRKILYEKLNLPTVGIKKTQSGFSTAASELKKLRGQSEVIEWLEEYRELAKLLSTYVKPLPRLVDEKTGRIYSSFNQTVAATGRLSSVDPNLQNIPVRTDLGQEVREAFVAEDGFQLVKADYSQLELRIAAHMSGDEKLCKAFAEGEDVHTATAAWVTGTELDEVTSDQRRLAKTLNFGVLYGMGAQKFAAEAGVSVEEARSFVERWRKTFAGVAQLQNEIIEQAQAVGFVETLSGRRRPVEGLQSRTMGIRSAAERVAFNFPIQGTEADILKKAMIDLYAHMKKKYSEANMILSVHDEIVCEVPKSEVLAFAKDMKSIMESVWELNVPLIVEVEAGYNWQNTENILA